MQISSFRSWCFLLVVLFGWPSLALSAPSTTRPAPSLPLAKNKAAVVGFVKARFEGLMKKHHVPGAIVSIVEGNQVIVEQGFGFATQGARKRAPVDPKQTLFRVGSLSKLVTATAIMRLVEQKKLDLRADVSRYFKPAGIALKRRFSEKINLIHLLTHTSGFDVTDIGDAAHRLADHIPLRSLVANYMTPQIYPPGAFHVYTNHGYAALGLLIALAHKKPFAASMKELIFQPLGMRDSSFSQPLPKALRPRLAKSYAWKGGYRPLPLDVSNVGPADVLFTTARDMSTFMMAHLNQGAVGTKRVLAASTVQEMHRRHFGYAPSLAGHALGFKEVFFSHHLGHYGKIRALYHTGGQLGFTSVLILVPSRKLGIFICLNRRKGAMRRAFVRAFLKRFYPAPTAKRNLAPVADPARYVGEYLRLGYPRSTVEGMLYLVNPRALLAMKPGTKGALTLDGYGCLRQQKPLLLESCKGSDVVAFRTNKSGKISHMMIEQRAYMRVHALNNPRLHRGFLLLSLLFFVLLLLQWPIGWWLGRHDPPASEATRLQRMARLTGLVFVAFVVGMVISLLQAIGVGWDYGLPRSTQLLLYLPYVATLMTVILGAMCLQAWTQRIGGVLWRVTASLAWALGCGCLGIFWFWNLFVT